MNIKIINADFNEIDADVLMVPIPSQGVLTRDLALKIKERAEDDIEEKLLEVTPFAIGASTFFPAKGIDNYSYLLFAPNRLNDQEPCRIENIRHAVRTAIVTTGLKEFQSLAIPHPGKCSVQIETKEIARAIIDEIKNYKVGTSLEQIIVFDTDEEYIKALNQFAFPQK